MWKPNQPGGGTPATPEPARPVQPVSTNPTSFESTPRPAAAPGVAAAGEQATIGKSLIIKGELSGSESLFIDGKVEGAINLPGNRVTIGRNGQVAANIAAREIVVLGKVRGNCQASDRVDIRSRRLADRRRHRRAHLHRRRRVLQGRHRHPQARRRRQDAGRRSGTGSRSGINPRPEAQRASGLSSSFLMALRDDAWRSKLYASYVSSGQAGGSTPTDPEAHFAPRRAFLLHILKTHLPADRDARIVELGCGHGAALYFLQQLGYRNAEGMDISAEQVELAHRLGIATARLGDLESALAAQPDASVDVVLAFDVFEHLDRAELFATTAEVRRVLKPGGICLLHVPNAEGLFGNRVRFGDLTHELAFTPSSVRQLFRCFGFREVLCFEDKPAVHGLKSAVRRAALAARHATLAAALPG